MGEVERLRLELTAKESKIRELEDALSKCAAIGIRLNEVLDYARDDEPTHAELASAIDRARAEP
jgi:hypothetical protein